MAITRTAWQDDDGSGTTGTVINNAEKTLLYNQIDGALALENWADIAFNAANFGTSGGGTWTVTSAVVQTITKHSTLYLVTLDIEAAGSTVAGGTPFGLTWKLPITAARKCGATFEYYGGATGVGYASMQAGTQVVNLFRDVGGTAWPAGNYYIGLQLHVPA